MAKQKTKGPAKTAAVRGTAPDAVYPGAGKARGKEKAGIGAGLMDGAKRRVIKPFGKGKLKAPGKKGAVVAVAEAAVAAHGALAGRLKPTRIHKIVTPPARMERLERLALAIDEVRRGGRASPRTRKLLLSGTPKMAQKVIEEAGEVAIEAIQGNRVMLINESVDLLYNLVVLLAAEGIPLDAIWAEMDRRELTLGMAEKLPKAFDPDG